MSEKLLTRKEFLRSGFRKLGDLIGAIKEGDARGEGLEQDNELPQPESRTGNGIAVINRKSCLGWSGGIICDLCKYKCPQGAILSIDTKPVIDHSRCDGCGLCNYICPTSPKAVEVISSR